MLGALFIDQLNEGGQSGRFALPHRPHNKEKALFTPRKLGQTVRQTKLLNRFDFTRNQPKSRAHRPLLIKSITAEAHPTGHAIRKVDIFIGQKNFAIFLRERLHHHAQGVFGIKQGFFDNRD